MIIVDDGSTDSTLQVALEWYKAHPEHFRVVSLARNQGKGGAVKVGTKLALGTSVLMVSTLLDYMKLFDSVMV
jgi:dolichyl-phosphate beta-glucosyltransferase